MTEMPMNAFAIQGESPRWSRELTELFIMTPTAPQFVGSWYGEFERLRTDLARSGISARPLPLWDMPAKGAVILASLAWGYHLDPATWLAKLDLLERSGARVLNPVHALRWNTNKTYLAGLYAAGLPVIPSIALTTTSKQDLAAARRSFGADILIAKPQIGACANGTARLSPGDRALPVGPVILQPYLPSIEVEGEISLIFLGGCFSHAVVKRPAPGDFRVQAEHGGSVFAVDPPLEALVAAHHILEAAPSGLVYARVDLVRDEAGRYLLMELELIEPQLFLNFASSGVGFLASAIRCALDRDPARATSR
jgi:hypothetical protein